MSKKPIDITLPDAKDLTVRNFLGSMVATQLIIWAILYATGSIASTLYTNGGALSKDLGSNNPLTLGAFLTGVVALVGLYFAIEVDPLKRFKTSAGESVQYVAASAILAVGVLNVVWEYLRVLAVSTDSHTIRQIDLIHYAFTPNILLISATTALVFGICYVARDSLKLTPRGFRRELALVSDNTKTRTDLLTAYRDNEVEKSIVLADGVPGTGKTKRNIEIALLVAISSSTYIVMGLIATGLGRRLADRKVSIGGLDLPLVTAINNHTAIVWVTLSIIWLSVEYAAFKHKRHRISKGLLVSRSELFSMLFLLIPLAMLYWVVTFFLGLAPFAVLTVFLAVRLYRHWRQMKAISQIWK